MNLKRLKGNSELIVFGKDKIKSQTDNSITNVKFVTLSFYIRTVLLKH